MASRDQESPTSEVHTVTKREVAAWCLYLLAFGLSVGHQLWLLQAHLAVLVEYKYTPWQYGYLHGIPTYVPAGVFILVFITVAICRGKYTGLWTAAGAGTLAAGSINTLTYPIQVIVYMCHDILLFLEALPLDAICLCWPEEQVLLLSESKGHVCECHVPYYGTARFTKAINANLTSASLTQIGYKTSAAVNLTYVTRSGDEWPGDTINTWDTTSFKTLNLLLQSCILITICRVPMYLLLQHLTFRDRQDKVNQDIRQRAAHITSDPNSARNVFQRLAKLRVEQVKFEAQIGREKRITLHTVIELCYFNFVEGLDAFTLYEDVVQYGDYFKTHAPLTVSLLTFVSITVFLVTTSNVFAMFPDSLSKYTKYSKLIVCILGNLPFLVIRCYLSYLAGGLSNRGISNIFLMFVVKECLVLVMGAVEFLMEMYAEDSPSQQGRKMSREQRGGRNRWAFSTSWNLASLRHEASILNLFFNSREDSNAALENGTLGSTLKQRKNSEISIIEEELGTVNAAFDANEFDGVLPTSKNGIIHVMPTPDVVVVPGTNITVLRKID